MNRIVRLLSMLLCVVMLLSLFPAGAFAEELSMLDNAALRANGWNTWPAEGSLGDQLVACAIAQENKKAADLGFNTHWCAQFVSKCARLVGIPTNTIPEHDVAYFDDIIETLNGTEVNADSVLPGDIVQFLTYKEGKIVSHDHVGIMIEKGKCVSGNMNGQGKGSTFWKTSKVVICPVSDILSNQKQWTARYYRPNYDPNPDSPNLIVTANDNPVTTSNDATLTGNIHCGNYQPTQWGVDCGTSSSNLPCVIFNDSTKQAIESGTYIPISFNFKNDSKSDVNSPSTPYYPLKANTTYHYRFWVKYNVNGENRFVRSEIKQFTTESASVPVTGVSLSAGTLSLKVGASQKLTATVSPSNATNKNVTWTSSNTAVATVASDGTVKAVKAGTATITVKTADGNKTAKCTVSVTANSTATPIVFTRFNETNKNCINSRLDVYFTYGTDNKPVRWDLYMGLSENNLYHMDALKDSNTYVFTDQSFEACPKEMQCYVNFASELKTSILRPGTTYYCKIVVTTVDGKPTPSDIYTFTTDTPVEGNRIYDGDLHTYVRYDTSCTWIHAENFCERNGGHLATILNETDQTKVQSLFNGTMPKNIYFIGARDVDTEDTWTWLTGETFYINGSVQSPYIEKWGAYEPSKSGDSEDYSGIMGNNVSTRKKVGDWIDIFNGGDTTNADYTLNKCGFICEYDYVVYNANGGENAPGRQQKELNKALTLTASTPSHKSDSNGNYTVTLDANGGTVSKNSWNAKRTVEYTFKNWNTKADGKGTSYDAGASYTANGAATLYAQWSKENEKIETITLPKPTRTGYTFKGWGTSKTATSVVTTEKYTPSKNITLYAVWEENALTMQYNTNGGGVGENNNSFMMDKDGYILRSGNRTVSTWRYGNNYKDGLINDTSFALTRPGYTFRGWRVGTNENSTVYDQNLALTPETICPELKNGNQTITLYAVWKESTYTVTYNANGGTGAPADQTKTFNEALTLTKAKPTRDGFFFIGWAETANANSAAYQPGGSFTKNADVTLYAVWIKPDLTLPAALTTIEPEAFAGGGFNSVLIPPTVKEIASDAFGDRTDLIILGTSGSYAETFAGEKHFTFVPVA